MAKETKNHIIRVSPGGGHPVGVIYPWAEAGPPDGWAFCKGQQVSRADFPELFGILGTTYGPGNITDTFNLPDLTEPLNPAEPQRRPVPFGALPEPPTEWFLGGNEHSFGLICEGERVCTFAENGDPDDLNGRLMEQAPALLRALERAWRVFRNDPHGEDAPMLEAIERAWPGRIQQLQKQVTSGG